MRHKILAREGRNREIVCLHSPQTADSDHINYHIGSSVTVDLADQPASYRE
jgi:hypothetical protein